MRSLTPLVGAWLRIDQSWMLLPYPGSLPQATEVLSHIGLVIAGSQVFPAIRLSCQSPLKGAD